MAFTVLIPAAGRSSRMGFPKGWLQLGASSLLQHITDTAVAAEALGVVVVAGIEDPEDDPSLVARIDVAMEVRAPAGVRLSVALGAPDAHPIDSIRAGLELVPPGSDVLLWPVDQPFASAALVRDLVGALGTARDRIALPKVGEARVHPVLFGAQVAAELLGPDADEGAHGVVRKDPERLILVNAQDERLRHPLNTPHDAKAMGIRVPSRR